CVQFALHLPGVNSVALSTTDPSKVKRNVASVETPVPREFWNELKNRKLIAENSPTTSFYDLSMTNNKTQNPGLIKQGNLWPFILITSLFMLWGLANNMTDTLLAAFKRIMSMTDFQTSWIQLAFYGAYFCLAFPAALYIRKFTYKSGILLGLGLFAFGSLLFYPASLTMSYGFFLLALYILAGGLSI